MMQEKSERADGTEGQNSYMKQFGPLLSSFCFVSRMLVSILSRLSLPNEAMQRAREEAGRGRRGGGGRYEKIHLVL